MERSRVVPLVRIAASAVCITACVLLVVLWVRSYWWRDGLTGPLPVNHRFSLSTAYGRVRYATFDNAYQHQFTGWVVTGWHVSADRIKRPPNLKLVNTPLSDFGLGFAGSSDRYGIVAIFPIWVPLIITATIAAAFWGRFRFSLRAMLIFMTLFAILLGILAVAK